MMDRSRDDSWRITEEENAERNKVSNKKGQKGQRQSGKSERPEIRNASAAGMGAIGRSDEKLGSKGNDGDKANPVY